MLNDKAQQEAGRAPVASWRVRLRDGLAILAMLLGGLWAGIEFFWDKLIAPQLEPALVQISTSTNIVGRTDCCVLVEVEATLRNTGRRVAYIHASHMAAGAKKLQVLGPDKSSKSFDPNEALLEKHLNLPAASGTLALDPLYGAAGPAGAPYLLLALGNLVSPGAKIAPGESIVRRLALVVPAEYPFVSLRALAFVVHQAQASQGISWNWTLAPQTLELQVVPWRTADLPRFRELRACGLASADQRAQACRDEALAGGKVLWNSFFQSDRHAYIQPHAMDFLAWRAKEARATNP